MGPRTGAPGDNDLTKQHSGRPIGQTIMLRGRVLDSDGRAVPNTLIEIWQTNASGAYVDPADPGFMSLDPNFTGAGRTITDSEGRYYFRTIKPAAYPGDLGALFRPGHIHVSLFGPLLTSRLVTQCYFEGDPLQDRDPIFQSIRDPRVRERLIARFNSARHRGRRRRLGARLRLGRRAARDGRDANGERPLSGEGDPLAGVPSPSQTMGPLYGFALMFEGSHEAVPPDSPGAVRIEGLILDGDGGAAGLARGLHRVLAGRAVRARAHR